MESTWLSIVLLLGLPLLAIGQGEGAPPVTEHPNAIKIGYMQGHIDGGSFLLGYERNLLRNTSLAVDIGMLPFNPNGHRNAPFFGLTAMLEARQFVLLRRSSLAGVFIGLHLGGNRIYRYFDDPRALYSTATWAQAGGTIGFQWPLVPRLLVGGGIRGGYSRAIAYRYFDRTGQQIGAISIDQPYSFFIAIQFAYTL